MSKKIIWLVIVIVVVVGGFVYFTNFRNQEAEQLPISDIQITYTDSGFVPNSMEIQVGESVTFRNESSTGMWVASAPHPTHTDYPEFDAKRSYAKGESFAFTFTKTGNWKFHNHLNPTNFGSITVK